MFSAEVSGKVDFFFFSGKKDVVRRENAGTLPNYICFFEPHTHDRQVAEEFKWNSFEPLLMGFIQRGIQVPGDARSLLRHWDFGKGELGHKGRARKGWDGGDWRVPYEGRASCPVGVSKYSRCQ